MMFGEYFLCFATSLLLIFYLLHYIIEHAHERIHHLSFWRISAQDTDSFENGNSVQKKKMAYMILRVLQASECKKQYIITKKFHNKQRNQTVMFISLKIFPQPAKMLPASLQCEFFLKAPCSIQLKEYLVVYGSQPTSKVGSHRLHYSGTPI